MSSHKVGIGNQLKTTSSPSSVPRGLDENIAHSSFGSIGYTFRKYFPGHGYFTGRVVKIRKGAALGKDRRCEYCDGDVEDLSLSDLRELQKNDLVSDHQNYHNNVLGLEQSDLKGESILPQVEEKDYSKSSRTLRGKKRKLPGPKEAGVTNKKTASSSKSQEKPPQNPFTFVHDLVPVDTAAERTLVSEAKIKYTTERRSYSDTNKSYDSDESQDSNIDIWLENIASLLGAGHRSKQSCKTSSVPSLSSESNSASSISSFSGSAAKLSTQQSSSQTDQCGSGSTSNKNIEPSSLSSIQSMTKLIDIPPGKRFGLKVIKINCKTTHISEVILEHSRGWIEVNMKGKLEKFRPGDFVVAPDNYNIGDLVDVTSLKQKKRVSAPPSNSRNSSVSREVAMKGKKPRRNPLDASCSSSTSVKHSRKPLHEMPADHLYYWCCNDCTMINTYSNDICSVCETKMSFSCKQSLLLQIVSNAVIASSTIEEAISMIPEFHLPAICTSVVNTVFNIHRKKKSKCKNMTTDTSHRNIDSIFYWICSQCTMRNSYKRSTCSVCTTKKDATSPLSALLEIATGISENARCVEEAMSLLPLEHKLAIPQDIFSSLITCVAMIGKNNNKRRCLRPRAPGVEYCTFHCDSELLESNTLRKYSRNEEKEICSEVISSHRLSIEINPTQRNPMYSIQSRMKKCFKNYSKHLNELNWHIHSIEDSILSQSNVPFPLGLLVRRFFVGYNFHDGRIIQVKRKRIIDEHQNVRHFLIYLVKYNDGDTEELLHHEIISLRQFYDQCNIKDVAPYYDQIPEGTIYEAQLQAKVKIPNRIDQLLVNNGSNVIVDFCKKGSRWSRIEIELTKLQLIIKGKTSDIESQIKGNKEQMIHSNIIDYNAKCPKKTPGIQNQLRPVLEWASCTHSTMDSVDVEEDASCADEKGFELSPGLWLSTQSRAERNYLEQDSSFKDERMGIMHGDDQSSLRPGLSQNPCGWDPAGGLDLLEYDPYRIVHCEVCGIDKDDHLILICDMCQRGFHMYCVRPVIVNVPTKEWLCFRCSPLVQRGKSYHDIVNDFMKDTKIIIDFLKLSFDEPKDFCKFHKENLNLFSPTTHISKRTAILGPSKSKPTVKVGSLFYPHKPKKNDWSPPLSLADELVYTSSLATFVAAMKYCDMQSYSEELVYRSEDGITVDMNDASLDEVESISQRNIETFKEFKENLKQGAFPPVQIVYDGRLGFSVEALAVIPKHTLIAEYIGEITTIERSGETSSDSLMVLLNTSSPKTSLLIDPTRTGNIARFLSGINNGNQSSRRKANVRTRRFSIDGRCRVALFTAKRIEPGDKLHYDYNAGVEGKSPVEWAKNGFYDTTHFF